MLVGGATSCNTDQALFFSPHTISYQKHGDKATRTLATGLFNLFALRCSPDEHSILSIVTDTDEPLFMTRFVQVLLQWSGHVSPVYMGGSREEAKLLRLSFVP